MTDKQINKLADLIADKLIAKQKEYDEQFHVDLQQVMSDNMGSARQITQEELILAEMARLMTLLSSYEEREEYEKASVIKNKLDKLQKLLDEL
tara:strand:+ start:1005 stop:1283 length:279 start_codon:yes stop_codon:yes gene_type:complete